MWIDFKGFLPTTRFSTWRTLQTNFSRRRTLASRTNFV